MVGRSAGATGVIMILAAVAGCSSSTTRDGPWLLARSSPTSSSVIVEYLHGTCEHLTGALTARSTASIRIRLRLEQTADVFDAALRSSFVRVRLGAPLGSRHVVGGCRPSTDRQCGPLTTLPIDLDRFRVIDP